MALPHELAARHAGDPNYQKYLNWAATGGRWGWWTKEAARAAQQAGLARALARPAGVVRRDFEWGESKDFLPSGEEWQGTNPAWVDFVNRYMAANPGGTSEQPGGSPSTPPPSASTGPGTGQGTTNEQTNAPATPVVNAATRTTPLAGALALARALGAAPRPAFSPFAQQLAGGILNQPSSVSTLSEYLKSLVQPPRSPIRRPPLMP